MAVSASSPTTPKRRLLPFATQFIFVGAAFLYGSQRIVNPGHGFLLHPRHDMRGRGSRVIPTRNAQASESFRMHPGCEQVGADYGADRGNESAVVRLVKQGASIPARLRGFTGLPSALVTIKV